MRNIFIFSGFGAAVYLLFGGYTHSISSLTGTSTFGIAAIEEIKPGLPHSTATLVCEYLSQESQPVTLDHINITAKLGEQVIAQATHSPNKQLIKGQKVTLRVPLQLLTLKALNSKGKSLCITSTLTLDGEDVTDTTLLKT